MVNPRVLTMRALRQGPAGVVNAVASGEDVFAGAHRKPEGVVMSVGRYERLTAAQQRVVESATASLQMEGLPPTDSEVDAARELAAGRIDFAEYRRRVDA
jgi:hypothetical protein